MPEYHTPIPLKCRACGKDLKPKWWPPGAPSPDSRCRARSVSPAHILAMDGNTLVAIACSRKCFRQIEQEHGDCLDAINLPKKETAYYVTNCDVKCGRCNLKGMEIDHIVIDE